MSRTKAFWLMIVVCLLPSTSGAQEDSPAIQPDVVYGHKLGMALTMDVYRPAEQNGAAVLFMVSGGWRSAWAPPELMRPIFQPLLDKGFTVFSVRHGSSPKFNIPEIVEDVRRSVRFVRSRAKEFGIDPERIGVCGGSAGGHLSLVLGTTADEGDEGADDPVLKVSDRVQAVVAFYPPTDIRPWVSDDSPYSKNYPALRFASAQAGDYSPLLHVSKDDAATLLVHGDKDELVPLSHSENIYKKLQETGVASRLLVIEGAGHGFGSAQGRRAAEALLEWFEEHLGPDGKRE